MRNSFLSKPPGERYKEMLLLLREFQVRATELMAPFTILVYGSASYGLKKSRFGHLDDIDLFLVIPRKSSVEDILHIFKRVFQTSFDIEAKHLHDLLCGKWEMCRMYGESRGIRLGFRLLCIDTFQSLGSLSGSIATIRNVAKIGQSRIVVDVEWSVKEWRYVSIELESTVINEGGEILLSVNHHVFSEGIERLGALGRKLLTCSVLYDPTKNSREVIKTIWKAYVQSCLKYHPRISTGSVVDSVMRSEKFSSAFRRKLIRIVNKMRI